MNEETDDEIPREPPDPEKLERMRDNAVNASHINTSSAQREVRAQILQTQQLNYDVHRLNGNISELNENLETYSTWSRALTLVLICLGVLQLIVTGIQVYSTIGI